MASEGALQPRGEAVVQGGPGWFPERPTKEPCWRWILQPGSDLHLITILAQVLPQPPQRVSESTPCSIIHHL